MHLAGITTNRDGRGVSQQARNLLMRLDDEAVRPRFLVRDRDSKFSMKEGLVVNCAVVRLRHHLRVAARCCEVDLCVE